MNIIDHIRKTYGRSSALATEQAFTGLHLPLPEQGEFSRSWDNGYLVFLNPAACVIRLTEKLKFPDCHSPHIQEPLITQSLERLRLDIYPGMACPINAAYIKPISKNMEEKGILLWDEKVHNFGYRPATDSLTHNIPVLLDPLSVQKLSDSVSMIQQLIRLKTRFVNNYLLLAEGNTQINPLESQDPYSHLRAIYKSPDHSIDSFWRAASDDKRKGLLIAGWLTKGMKKSGYKKAYQSSILYEQRWKGPQ